jgi:hypothetical protein
MLVQGLVFKTMVGLNKVPGRFDSYAPPPLYKLLYISLGFFLLPGRRCSPFRP